MKNSKALLGITSCILGIAGVASSRIHKLPIATVYYKKNGNWFSVAAKCNSVPLGNQCTINGNKVYTDVACTVPAYYHAN